MTQANPHALNMLGPVGSKFPVHHKRKCRRDSGCRGCSPHAQSHQGAAILAQRMGSIFGDTKVRAIIEVPSAPTSEALDAYEALCGRQRAGVRS